MSVSSLSGAELHRYVAIADNRINPHIEDGECRITHGGEDGPVVRFDQVWFLLQIMPREARQGLDLKPDGERFVAGYTDLQTKEFTGAQSGDTREEAMMRAFVARRRGAV